nr:hypothetical protein [uncultured Mediterranean phage uvMED]|tara:strand:+ start:301 stop:855 length:555 start_codon:yes stop_codon:yes gene_type:complete
MENIDSVSEALDLSKEVSSADEIENTEVGFFLSEAPVEKLVIARIPITHAQDATKKVRSFADNYISKDVEEKGSYKVGDTVFHSSKAYKYKVMDLPQFFRWLLGDITEEQVNALCAVVGPTFVPKLRALDAISSMRGKNAQTIRDTFIERTWADNPTLQVINCDSASAPKWAQSMEEGTRREKS